MSTVPELLADYDACLGVTTPPLSLPTTSDLLSARLPAVDLAIGSVATLETAAGRMRSASGMPARRTTLLPDRVAAAFSGDRMQRVDGDPVDRFAPLSGFFRAADGWVRTHANYPHHGARLIAALGLPGGCGQDELARHLRTREAQQLEDLAADAGAIAVRVRDEHEWAESQPGRALGRFRSSRYARAPQTIVGLRIAARRRRTGRWPAYGYST